MATIDPHTASIGGGPGADSRLVPAPPEVVAQHADRMFGEAFKRTAVGMALIGLDGRFLRANGALAQIMGRTTDELLQTTWPAIAHPESRGAIEGFMSEALAGRMTTRNEEMVYVKTNDDTGCALVSASLVCDDKGRALFFLAQLFDLTERKAIEQELEDKTSWVKLLQSVAVAANAAVTFEAAVQAAVDEVCKETGWPVGHVFRVEEDDELASTTIWHLSDPATYEAFRHNSENALFDPGQGLPGRVLSLGRPQWINDVSIDESFIRRHAARKAGLKTALAFPVSLEDRPVAIMEFFSDRYERPDAAFLEVMEHIGTLLGHAGEHRLVEEALVEHEQRTRQILETAGDAYIEMDINGLITEWNAQATQSFGWEKDDVIGRALCRTIIPERYRDAHNQGLARYRETGDGPLLGQRVEISALRRDGSEIPIELTLWATTAAGVTSFSAFLHDISERVEAQRALEEANLELQAKVAELEQRNNEVNELIKAREGLRVLSLRDPLTNMFNRRYMEESLEREIRRAMRNGQPLGIMMIDIDHFKQINDTYGHEAGDLVLQALATFFHDNIRGGDIACRYGGEEFLLLFPDAPLDGMRKRADNLRSCAAQLQIIVEGKAVTPPTLSIGVAVFPDDGETSQAVVRAADAALYRAKTSGRDRVVSAGELL